MARLKDANKRTIIIHASKILFAHKGFYNTSISDIARETALPIGSIYTYFKSKDQIIGTIIEDGWKDLYSRLKTVVSSQATPKEKLKTVIEKFFPDLLNDLDFINIILTEALAYTKIEEKIEKLSELLFGLVTEVVREKNGPTAGLTVANMNTGLVIYFLGILNAAKLSRVSSIGIKKEDILNFIKYSVEQYLGIKF